MQRDIKMNGRPLSSSYVMPPMATEGTETGEVTEAMIRYYEKMVKNPNFGLFILEHAFVEERGKASPKQLSLAKDSDLDGHKKLVESIKTINPDAQYFLQLNHAGIKTRGEYTGADPIAVAKRPWDKTSSLMTAEDFTRIEEAFAAAAARAKEAGYDGVELHVAHGYLLNQFLSPLTNFREDDYGKDRVKYPLEVFSAIKKAVGDYPVAVRIGGIETIEGGTTVEEGVEAALRFEEAGASFLDMTGGMTGYVRKGVEEPGWFGDLSAAVKEKARVPVMLTGGVKTKEEADKLLEENKADLIGIGRAFLQNPDWGE
nr:NADH:flavin oxidoreductase [uncultured Peptoniphilus sp.]